MLNTRAILIITVIATNFWVLTSSVAQDIDAETISKRVKSYKNENRGPYKDIRWFCPDGSVVPPQERCAQTGGVQRARYKDEVESLAKSNQIYLGQILSTTRYGDFLDAKNSNSRLVQYQLEKYLRAVDDGWINRKAQYYRGAFQSEDEESWGKDFYLKILSDNQLLTKQYFLVRQSLKDVPHKGDNNKAQLIRSQSKFLSDQYAPFMDLRIKLHGQPEANDIVKVKNFKQQHTSKLTPDLLKKFDELIATMDEFYQPVNTTLIVQYSKPVSANSPLKLAVKSYAENYPQSSSSAQKIKSTTELLYLIRKDILSEKSSEGRLALLDISLLLEEIIFKEVSKWKVSELSELLLKINVLAQSAAGMGFLELWEWEKLHSELEIAGDKTLSLDRLNWYLTMARRAVEWGIGTVKASYQEPVTTYSEFEPLAYGFIDDRIRASVLLPLGKSVGLLGELIAQQSGFSNQVLTLPDQSEIRGLNPGYATGELVVISGSSEALNVSSDKIYILEKPPSDLKPVAGIATVSEGNLVSHVQLMARNLGIPNAVISDENLQNLKKYSGQEVFYAVSNKGTVLMKLATEMTPQEKALFEVKKRKENKIRVPVENVVLDQDKILHLRNVKSTDSGVLCGPKAANLGQLKQLFPTQVVEGLVIPFGIFYKHMQQKIPGSDHSYWAQLKDVYQATTTMRSNGSTEEEIENYTLQQLEILRAAIKEMPLLPEFTERLTSDFQDILGKPLGSVPVFLRSDTNMEDLKEFTGAGLNLTLFNVVDKAKIIQGIKDVWASPYSERSYKWRQKYLLNPENVYPS
ncbi:MAG: PEP/pyruvate-binding domain-containing protein, partial [Tunicatimonas sp.]|uniref:PEP/pyruvate-binding domain-containing protein n=1 Tax=Tunicatimonas sp. TaxID=1940096 RepID=UPI003C751FC2